MILLHGWKSWNEAVRELLIPYKISNDNRNVILEIEAKAESGGDKGSHAAGDAFQDIASASSEKYGLARSSVMDYTEENTQWRLQRRS